MMRPYLLLILRRATPHTTVSGFLVGTVVGLSTAPEPAETAVIVAVLVLLGVAVTAARLWSTGRQSTVMGIAGAGSGGAAAVLAMSGNWYALLALAGLALVQWLFYLPPVIAAERVSAELAVLVGDGVLIPVMAILVASGDSTVPWPLLAVTVSLAGSLSGASLLQEEARSATRLKGLGGVISTMGAAVVSLGVMTVSVVAVLAGAGVGLRPELVLLATPVSVIALVFGWLALADPRPQWRYRRVELLVTASGLSLALGLAVVLLAA